MQMNCINQIPGKILAAEYSKRLNQRLKTLKTQPTLAIIQVGADPASSLYVNLKAEMAREVGLKAEVIKIPLMHSKQEIIAQIHSFNENPNVTGIIIQAPIPELNLSDSIEIFNSIMAAKDVDGLTDHSLGRLWQLKSLTDLASAKLLLSATPMAVLKAIAWVGYAIKRQAEGISAEELKTVSELEKFVNLDEQTFYEFITNTCSGRKVIIINRSNIVGKPISGITGNG